jgi:type I restriction enzyme S subunit
MLSRANTAELVARSVIVPENSPANLLMSDKIVRLHFLDDRLKKWINLVNNSKQSRTYYKENATGTSDSMRNVSRKVIHELSIPLPPLDIQIKILHKVEKLVTLCDLMKDQYERLRNTSKNLALASVAAITGTQIKEQEKMKVPKTELVSKLRIAASPPANKEQAPLSAILVKHNGELSAKALWNYSGLEIDRFYQQLKIEMARGWIVEPEKAFMKEKEAKEVEDN